MREALANLAHEQWCGWMKWMFNHGYFESMNLRGVVQAVWIMPNNLLSRWQRQMNTPYKDLPENEKESDRNEADRILKILHDFSMKEGTTGK